MKWSCFEKAELALKIACAEEMKRCLIAQKKRYPLMNEEDVVKFAFQGMLGVGHLIRSEEDAVKRLQEEMSGLEPNPEEPYVEKISSDWLRMNLRAAKARGVTEADIAYMLCRSAQHKPLSFTRQNVYNFCVKLALTGGSRPQRRFWMKTGCPVIHSNAVRHTIRHIGYCIKIIWNGRDGSQCHLDKLGKR